MDISKVARWYPNRLNRQARQQWAGQPATRPAAILMRECPECGKHTKHRVKEHAGVENWTCEKCGWHRSWRVG